jgi:hypothetical protein
MAGFRKRNNGQVGRRKGCMKLVASSFYSTVGAKLMGQVQERYRTTSVWIRTVTAVAARFASYEQRDNCPA